MRQLSFEPHHTAVKENTCLIAFLQEHSALQIASRDGVDEHTLDELEMLVIDDGRRRSKVKERAD
jgi:hypothetical protein